MSNAPQPSQKMSQAKNLIALLMLKEEVVICPESVQLYKFVRTPE